MASKAYETYRELARLINSDKKENIDRAYDALASITDEKYENGIKAREASYTEQRNALAANRAKAERYLNYFLVDNGYANTGVETDMKLKSSLAYDSQRSELEKRHGSEIAELESEKNKEHSENEAKRAAAQSEADTELNEQLYRSQKDEADNALKSEELNKKYGYYSNSSSSGWSGSGTSSSSSAVEAYRTTFYNSMMTQFDHAETSEDMQRIYDSVTGVHAEQAQAVFGTSRYKSLISYFRKKLDTRKLRDEYTEEINELLYTFRNAEDLGEEMSKIYREIRLDKNPRYTIDQFNKAVKYYKEGLSH